MRKRAKKNRKQKRLPNQQILLLLTALTNLIAAIVNLIDKLSQD